MKSEHGKMDGNLAYMYVMKEEARGKVPFKKATLMEYGSKVKLFPGVPTGLTVLTLTGRKKGSPWSIISYPRVFRR